MAPSDPTETDPDSPFHLCWQMGVEIIAATKRMARPVLYSAETNEAVVSPGYLPEEYRDAADELLSLAASRMHARSA